MYQCAELKALAAENSKHIVALHYLASRLSHNDVVDVFLDPEIPERLIDPIMQHFRITDTRYEVATEEGVYGIDITYKDGQRRCCIYVSERSIGTDEPAYVRKTTAPGGLYRTDAYYACRILSDYMRECNVFFE